MKLLYRKNHLFKEQEVNGKFQVKPKRHEIKTKRMAKGKNKTIQDKLQMKMNIHNTLGKTGILV